MLLIKLSPIDAYTLPIINKTDNSTLTSLLTNILLYDPVRLFFLAPDVIHTISINNNNSNITTKLK